MAAARQPSYNVTAYLFGNLIGNFGRRSLSGLAPHQNLLKKDTHHGLAQ
jgi:hypothetical protein